MAKDTFESLAGFTTCDPFDGLIFDARRSDLPSAMFGFVDEVEARFGGETSTVYGYVFAGPVQLSTETGQRATLTTGQYFCAVGEITLSGAGKAILFERFGYRGVFGTGGPVEKRGRVVYIDACSTSILVFPQRRGDPVFNILWFPEQVRQSMHIHPTLRLACVIHGNGICETPSGNIPLEEGKVFYLEPMAKHCFHTNGERMAIVTYHPDSDWGPSDEVHPMMNQTILAPR